MNMLGSMFSMVKPRLDDLGTDRLNYYYSTLIIMGMSLTITARQYVGSPLQCWVPAQFTKAWEQYAEDYCFVYNTYWVKPNDKVPDTVEERVSQQLIYYQWAPFIMAFEAAFFYLPVICWSMLSTKSGINIIKLVETAQKAEGAESEDRKKQIDIICRHISNNLRKRKSEEETTKMAKIQKIFGMQHGKYLTNVYIVTKFIYMSNSFLQFYSTNKFLGQNDPYWGMRILDDILHGTDWEHSGNFPRIAMCDFQVRVLGNLQRHSIQCVLSLNMFNEKIFLFIENQDEKDQKFAKKFRREQQILLFSEFCLHKFTPDIIILLKMINNHTADIVCTEIVGRMWNEFLERDAEVVLERLVGNNHINDSRTSSLKSVLDQEKLI
uniref:Innexin n=1 Tax=Caenorhabditis japonica TaxID=281687 RepID=A0A8R1I5Z7_CAEJA